MSITPNSHIHALESGVLVWIGVIKVVKSAKAALPV